MPVNFAIVGPGRIADYAFAPALARTPGVQLWSVLSRDAARASAFADRHHAAAQRPAHTGLDALLEDPELHAVIIASPDKLHAEQGIRCAEAGKHVLVEKPMTTDVESARALVDACRKHDVRLGVAYHLRWHAGHRALMRRIRAGDLGEIRHMRVSWTFRADDASNWRASPDVGQWWALAGVGTHCLDLVRWWLVPGSGEVRRLSSLTTQSVWKTGHDETAILALEHESGTTAEIVCSVLFDSTPRVEVYGERGTAICKGTLGPHGAGQIRVGGRPLEFTPVGPYEGEIADFAAAIVDDRDPEVPGEEGLRNVELLVQATG